jgi:hypothetical protein
MVLMEVYNKSILMRITWNLNDSLDVISPAKLERKSIKG